MLEVSSNTPHLPHPCRRRSIEIKRDTAVDFMRIWRYREFYAPKDRPLVRCGRGGIYRTMSHQDSRCIVEFTKFHFDRSIEQCRSNNVKTHAQKKNAPVPVMWRWFSANLVLNIGGLLISMLAFTRSAPSRVVRSRKGLELARAPHLISLYLSPYTLCCGFSASVSSGRRAG